MKIANQNLLESLVEGTNTYTVKDTKYIIAAATITTSKFGPSGSSKKKNSALENIMAVIPRMRSWSFFDVISILVIVLNLTQDEAYKLQARLYGTRLELIKEMPTEEATFL